MYNVIAVRYELELRSVDNTGLENYMLAKDVDAESLAAVAELGIPGVIIQSGTVREYKTAYAAHLLGTIGAMGPDEWTEYQQKGYAMNAMIGTSGIEKAIRGISARHVRHENHHGFYDGRCAQRVLHESSPAGQQRRDDIDISLPGDSRAGAREGHP